MARSKKVWLRAEYWACSKTLELAQNALLEAGAIGIEIDDGMSPEKPPKYAPDCIRVLGYFEPSPDIEAVITEHFKNFFENCDFVAGTIVFFQVLEEDWQGNFVRSCTTFMVEPRIFVVPSFEIDDFKKNPQGDLFIEMDPENAFGTGQHQTTKLCLKNIALLMGEMTEKERAKLRVLDVGTGSGILAILAKKLGAHYVLASETDEDAVITARKNAEKNEVDIEVIEVTESDNYEAESYNFIVANILAPTLIDMSSVLIASCVNDGLILLSGILVSQAADVIKTYESFGAKLLRQENMDDWCALIFARIKAP